MRGAGVSAVSSAVRMSAGGRTLVLAAVIAMASTQAAYSKTIWQYAQFPDSEGSGVRHTVQTRIEYDGAVASLAFVCVRGTLVLTVVATWPIAAFLHYRFPPEEPQFLSGNTPVPSSAVFQGAEVLKLFETALIRRELMVRIPGPRTITERTLTLDGFAEKAQPLKDACGEKER